MIVFDTYTDYIYDIELFLDIYFICDIIINFFTTYKDEKGNYVYSLSQIGVNYIKTFFFVDLLTSIPLGRLFGN